MKKNTMIWIIVVVILLAAAGIGVVLYNNSQTKTMDTMNTTTNTTTNTNTTETTTPGTVSIDNFSFSPATITINKGETVTWKNNDSAPHQVVADDSSFELSKMSTGGTSQHTFDMAGTYSYHCSIHPDMKGVVIVK